MKRFAPSLALIALIVSESSAAKAAGPPPPALWTGVWEQILNKPLEFAYRFVFNAHPKECNPAGCGFGSIANENIDFSSVAPIGEADEFGYAKYFLKEDTLGLKEVHGSKSKHTISIVAKKTGANGAGNFLWDWSMYGTTQIIPGPNKKVEITANTEAWLGNQPPLGTGLTGPSSVPAKAIEVPGPLPLLGVAAAFGYSRKLRKRIKDSKSLQLAGAID